jgi:hypothetical protein
MSLHPVGPPAQEPGHPPNRHDDDPVHGSPDGPLTLLHGSAVQEDILALAVETCRCPSGIFQTSESTNQKKYGRQFTNKTGQTDKTTLRQLY